MIKYICILIALCGSVLLHGTMYEAILNELMHEQKQEQNFLKKLSIDLLKTYDSFLKKIPSPPHSSMKNLQTDFIKIIGEKSGIRALSAVPKEPAKIIQLCVNRIEGWKDEVEKLLSQLPKDQHNEYKTLYALIKNFDQALEQLP